VVTGKWLIAAPIGIYLVLHSQKLVGALSLSWPFVAGVLGVLPPPLVGKLERLFMTRLEYTACTDSLGKELELCQNSVSAIQTAGLWIRRVLSKQID
jgi:hypothetical protein